MNESDIELLRIRLGSALVFLFKAKSRYRLDNDLEGVLAAIQQAAAMLGPTYFDDRAIQERHEQFNGHAQTADFNLTEAKFGYPSAIGGRGTQFSGSRVSISDSLNGITRALQRCRAFFRPGVKSAPPFDVMTKRS